MCKTKLTNLCNKIVENEIDITEVDTDVHGDGKSRLTFLLERFKDSIVTGFLCTRVSTSQLGIRLIGSNCTVRRSPHRLSEEERRIARDRISELIRSKIIRLVIHRLRILRY
jgi:hypothetical protein